MTLAELYGLSRQEGVSADRARVLLCQSHWFAVNADFDPKTGKALPQALSAFLARIAHPKKSEVIQDRLHRITEHVRPSVERLLRSLNESPRREQALLPVHVVRELDVNSFIKLSNRPGRNIREKLAGKPYLQAVRRYQSVNLPENRLLKAFCLRLAEFLEIRRDLLFESEDDLIARIHSWLRTDEALAIARWENLPPNNTLLAHRDYRRVWDSWRRLQSLEEDIARDLSRLDERQKTMTRWIDFGQMYGEGTHLFADMPVIFDYEDFLIQTWLPEPATMKSGRRIRRSPHKGIVAERACVDLVPLHPRFATSQKHHMALADSFLWQQWDSDSESVDINLFDSDAACIHPDSVTIAFSDLFFGSKRTADHCDRAARVFAHRLQEVFVGEKLTWLIPDAVNDFEMKTIRRNLNARLPVAEPLPRSVAAVFQQVDHSKITGDGYSVVVVDEIGGTTCATKLIAKKDNQLAKHLPNTKGFYWERCPPIILRRTEETKDSWSEHILTVDEGGQWREMERPRRHQQVDAAALKKDSRIGQFAYCIQVTKSPVAGGLLLDALQSRAEDIPLWRDQIPELSIKVIKDGRYQSFYLVSRGTTVKPIRGLIGQRILIGERFTLPAGRKFYQFPLFQGQNADELRFSARLDSPAFPLKANTECELLLTFRYGDDEPYDLVFVPLDKSFPSVRATWQPTVEEVVNDAPAPGYPEPLSWEDLRRMPKPDTVETSDFLEWFVSSINNLHYEIEAVVSPKQRANLEITADWRVDKKGKKYTFATNADGCSVFIHETAFLPSFSYVDFQIGDFISCEILQGADERLSGRRVAISAFEDDAQFRDHDMISELVCSLRRRLYVPIIQIWRDGRSITDRECPEQFYMKAARGRSYLVELIENKRLPEDIRCELIFLLSCLHKDAPSECVRWITDQVEHCAIRDRQSVGYSLGDVSRNWQIQVFRQLASKPNKATLRVFSYAIWRDARLVERFSVKQILPLLDTLLLSLEQLVPAQGEDGNQYLSAWPLELLLGLLRTRASDDPEIRMILQPHQKITQRLAEQIDRIDDIVAESNITLFSRVQLDVQKPEGIRTPDLIYALRLYLTGDDGANAIHITSVSDSDAD